MAEEEIAKAWLKKADEDMLFAKKALEQGLEFYSPICFHLHQAAEKYLKAYILANNLAFKRIHDLESLLKICAHHDSEFDKLADSVYELNPFYIETRYPSFAEAVDKPRAQQSLKAVEGLAEFVKTKCEVR